MCDMCNGATWDEVVEQTRERVARSGVQLQYVYSTTTSPPVCYTVGLTVHGAPEILLTGRMMEETADMLNTLADMVVNGRLVLVPELEVPLKERRVHLAPLEIPGDVLLIADEIYGKKLRALQAVWADDSDQLPWEQDVADVLTQPLFGSPPRRVLQGGRWQRID
ncbi:hypothetical protein GCM10027403_30100 [Arthrobacter tecti]